MLLNKITKMNSQISSSFDTCSKVASECTFLLRCLHPRVSQAIGSQYFQLECNSEHYEEDDSQKVLDRFEFFCTQQEEATADSSSVAPLVPSLP